MIILPWIRADLNAGEGWPPKPGCLCQTPKAVELSVHELSWAAFHHLHVPELGLPHLMAACPEGLQKGGGKETPSWNLTPYKWRALVTLIISWEPGLPRAARWGTGKLIVFFQPIFLIPWFTIHVNFLLSGVYICSFKNVGKVLL